jgi:GH24 family phage-related lysozyme (muramidase)
MAIPLAISVPVIAASAYSSYRQAQLTNAQLRAQAATAEANAETALLEGDLALKAAISLESESRLQTEQLIGTQRAAMAATGFAVGEGSFGDILEASAVFGEIDAAVIQYESRLIKYRKEKEAESLRARARALRASQQEPGLAGITGALGAAPLTF